MKKYLNYRFAGKISAVALISIVLPSLMAIPIIQGEELTGMAGTSSGAVSSAGGGGGGGPTYYYYIIPLVFSDGDFGPTQISIVSVSHAQVILGFASAKLGGANAFNMQPGESIHFTTEEESELKNGTRITSTALITIQVFSVRNLTNFLYEGEVPGESEDRSWGYAALAYSAWGTDYLIGSENSLVAIVANQSGVNVTINDEVGDAEEEEIELLTGGKLAIVELKGRKTITSNAPVWIVEFVGNTTTGTYALSGIPENLWGDTYILSQYGLPGDPPLKRSYVSLYAEENITIQLYDNGEIKNVEAQEKTTAQLDISNGLYIRNVAKDIPPIVIETSETRTFGVLFYEHNTTDGKRHVAAVPLIGQEQLRYAEAYASVAYIPGRLTNIVPQEVDTNILVSTNMRFQNTTVQAGESIAWSDSTVSTAANKALLAYDVGLQYINEDTDKDKSSIATILFPLNAAGVNPPENASFVSWYRIPNLVLEDAGFDRTPTQLERTRLRFSVKNDGRQAAPAFTVEVTLNGIQKLEHRFEGLRANESQEFEVEEFLWFGSELSYEINVDVDNEVTEGNEADNAKGETIEIQTNTRLNAVGILSLIVLITVTIVYIARKWREVAEKQGLKIDYTVEGDIYG